MAAAGRNSALACGRPAPAAVPLASQVTDQAALVTSTNVVADYSRRDVDPTATPDGNADRNVDADAHPTRTPSPTPSDTPNPNGTPTALPTPEWGCPRGAHPDLDVPLPVRSAARRTVIAATLSVSPVVVRTASGPGCASRV